MLGGLILIFIKVQRKEGLLAPSGKGRLELSSPLSKFNALLISPQIMKVKVGQMNGTGKDFANNFSSPKFNLYLSLKHVW